ncbi:MULTISPECIES: hypothetical protein [Cellulophaga]|uniref:Lipoprotein n=2 Tax=Cellulophaga TaxID=104264 RepID=F0RG14_CELLC|nr:MULTISPECIES: hypothetical protein [Cellulophaga]ADY27974.1 hypothetical protein Celly_0139 [Cellulophaga lytica DSM 7489]AIM59054.1 hypothetical protein IX49_00360 [Cellulophaga lytica]APU08856.1 hypothetical protein A5M85_00695 [Cellulophaga lytica]EWH14129.1 hypothetical protein KLA_05647 [Cellulophaga geojensis KL-A]MDO6854337.1 hypothetical protein [Cellulophaga lytica]
MIQKLKNTSLLLAALLLFSFVTNTACDLVNSNLEFALKQTKNAEKSQDINTVKFHTYKAIKIVQKLDKQLKDCGCSTANKEITEGLNLLKDITHSTSLSTAKLMLEDARKSISSGIDKIATYSKKTTSNTDKKISAENAKVYATVDSILIPLEKSMLAMTVEKDNCKEAYATALAIYEKNELKLMDESLTEAKKYYHLRSIEIAKKTMKKLEDCAKAK